MSEAVPISSFPIPGIENSLNDGCRLHAFSSGAGLRVVRIEKNIELKAYGEHPDIAEALAHASEDYLAGGREYKSVYGKKGKYKQYITGSSTCESNLDSWVRWGHTFDVWKNGAYVLFQLKGLVDSKIPPDLHERVKNEGSFQYTERGVVYEASNSVFGGASNSVFGGASIRCVSKPDTMSAHRVWSYYATRTGKGPDFWSALSEAFRAPFVEVDD